MLSFLIGGLLSLMATGIPIAICMLIIGIIYMVQQDIPMMVAAQYMTEGAMLNVLIAIPLYLLTGVLMNEVGMSHRIVRLCNAVVGHIRGGLAIVNVMACMIFAGMTGALARCWFRRWKRMDTTKPLPPRLPSRRP
jgi:TRAP-type mannitol/chloroaromatic compound transport system permease large subunit